MNTSTTAAPLSPADAQKTAADFSLWAIAYDHIDSLGFRTIVRRGPFCFCAYVGVPLTHALSGLEELDMPCHWGLTYNRPGEDGDGLGTGYHWFGWDYGHAGDALIAEDGSPLVKDGMFADLLHDIAGEDKNSISHVLEQLVNPYSQDAKTWTLGEVVSQAIEARQWLQEMTAQTRLQAMRAICMVRSKPRTRQLLAALGIPAKIKRMSYRRQKIALRKRNLS